tara:strand:+ start:4592 stop:5590 length:999 start_codon:yes stop_codon:yes gene_type:complete
MRCSIDLDCPGKREGFVQLNHSDNRHAYGVIPIPIGVVAADNDGPTVLLTAGNHGDEYEGIVILQRLFRDLDPSRIRGRIIIMPSLNLPAVRVYQRTSPLDGANMNRSFGAQDISGPTQEIAQFVEEQLIAQSDYAIDLHSGGKMCEFSPCGYIYAGGGRKRLQNKFNAAHQFGAKYTVVVEGSPGSLSAAGERAGVIMLSAELGGGRIRRENIELGYNGTVNALAGWNLLDHAPEETKTIFLRSGSASSSVMSPVGGVFEPLTDVGQQITAGDTVGRIYPLDALDQSVVTVNAQSSGVIIGQRTQACVQRGDFLLHLGESAEESELLHQSD